MKLMVESKEFEVELADDGRLRTLFHKEKGYESDNLVLADTRVELEEKLRRLIRMARGIKPVPLWAMVYRGGRYSWDRDGVPTFTPVQFRGMHATRHSWPLLNDRTGKKLTLDAHNITLLKDMPQEEIDEGTRLATEAAAAKRAWRKWQESRVVRGEDIAKQHGQGKEEA